MFDHFQIMFGLQKTTIFGKKNFFRLDRGYFFWLTEIFLKNFLVSDPAQKIVHVYEKT